jgi:hypothetical protein
MKTAFQNVLPAEILARRSKGNYAPLLRQQFLPTVHELLRMERFALAEIGVVEPQRVRDALRQCLEPTTVTPGAVMSFAFAEFWLRRVLFDEQDCSFGIDRATADDFTAEALLSGKQIFCDGTE